MADKVFTIEELEDLADNALSVQEAAELLNKTRMTVYRWIKVKKINHVKLGGTYYIPKYEIERLTNHE